MTSIKRRLSWTLRRCGQLNDVVQSQRVRTSDTVRHTMQKKRQATRTKILKTDSTVIRANIRFRDQCTHGQHRGVYSYCTGQTDQLCSDVGNSGNRHLCLGLQFDDTNVFAGFMIRKLQLKRNQYKRAVLTCLNALSELSSVSRTGPGQWNISSFAIATPPGFMVKANWLSVRDKLVQRLTLLPGTRQVGSY